MNVQRPRRAASAAKAGGRSEHGSAHVSWNKVLVALQGIEEASASAEGGRAGRYAAMRSLAQAHRGEVLDYLRANADEKSWRKASEVTAFGTFTVECTPAGLRVLRHAPRVESVVRASDTPLRIIR